MKEENKNIKQKIQPKNKGKNLVEENKKLVKELNELKAQVTKLTNASTTAFHLSL